VATLDARLGFLRRDGQTRCIAVTLCRRVQIGMPAVVRPRIEWPYAASKDASKITAKGMKSITNRFFGLIMSETSINTKYR
jgi:hypothetical protein